MSHGKDEIVNKIGNYEISKCVQNFVRKRNDYLRKSEIN